MTSLEEARVFAARVRLPEDRSGDPLKFQELRKREQHKDSMLRHGLLITEAMTPVLEKRLSAVCERLFIPRQSVTAFVYNRADVQADCVIDSPDSCVIRFTSGLINLMDEREFQFVAAHELGHFLLSHGACSQYTSGGSSEEFMIQRARELSADRIGFLGAGSLDESIEAIIKTASGLGDEFLRFDVASFISQASELTNPSSGESRNSTHPSMLIRCRALLWFSMCVTSLQDLQACSSNEMRDVDRKVSRDLEKFVDGHIRARKRECMNDIILWKSCVLIISIGSFKKEMQDQLLAELGLDDLEKVRSFLETYEKVELETEATMRLEACIKSLYEEFPSSAQEIETFSIKKAYEVIKIE